VPAVLAEVEGRRDEQEERAVGEQQVPHERRVAQAQVAVVEAEDGVCED